MAEMKVSATRFNNLAVKATARGHEVLSGESAAVGGGDEGMTPHELVLAGLCSCTVITCQMYANHKQWPLDRADVNAEILSVVDGKATIQMQIEFVGAQLSAEQRARLLEIAGKCPVHKMLSHAAEITATAITPA